uniref:Uncharacterized protein n=1 Tax=Anguilla anguilla TaxID=7936 RepID=A0A0E9UBV0_ANGAN
MGRTCKLRTERPQPEIQTHDLPCCEATALTTCCEATA